MNIVGQPMTRTDGIDKVTGVARYSAEHPISGLTHAVLVTSTIPKGRITAIDASDANRMPGVLLVMTHENAPRLPEEANSPTAEKRVGRVLSLLQNNEIRYNNEPVAVVVADTLELATEAAARLNISYERVPAVLDFERTKQATHAPAKAMGQDTDTQRGDFHAGLLSASAVIDATYVTPMEHHNPMEPHATIAAWDGDSLTLYDSTQQVSGVRDTVAAKLGIEPEKVRVICPYVGGGFGGKGSMWSHVALAAMAARLAGRPVKLVLDRTQMHGPVGARPVTEQRVMLGAMTDGRLTAMRHNVTAHTSSFEDWLETSAIVSRMLYACPNQETSHRLARMDVGTPTFMRAPGEATGTFALESAMDEMACALKIDPVRMRLQNHAEQDPNKNLPWSSKSLRQCYETGAARFGWARRNPEPRSMRLKDIKPDAGTEDKHILVGWGMATATYPANRMKASASVAFLADGTALVRSGSQDLGTGTYTIMTQVAAQALGLAPDKVRFELGDTALPSAPISGGSMTAASVGPAVDAAARAARLKLIGIALANDSLPLFGATAEEVSIEDGWLFLRDDPSRREQIAAIVARCSDGRVEATAEAAPGEERKQYSMHSFGAVFVEVHVDEVLGQIRVARIVGTYGIGKLLNQKTGYNQLMGGIVGGVGLALFEETMIDPKEGRAVNGNLAEYHVPVSADIGEIDVSTVEEEDPHINALGAKGIGEIGITGVAAAIANAVYHATGRRVRSLPITLDKLL